jgi:acyl carrier protein
MQLMIFSIIIKKNIMTNLTKEWKSKWALESISKEELENLVKQVINKQLDSTDIESINMNLSLLDEYDADSVDIVAMLLNFEEFFKSSIKVTNTVIPTDKLSKIILVEDLFDAIYQVLVEVENKLKLQNLPVSTLKIENSTTNEKVGKIF